MDPLSMKSSTVQSLRKLLAKRSEREAQGRFVVEGPVSTAEAVRAGWRCLMQFVPAGSSVEVPGAGPVQELAEGVFERVGSTQTPQPPLTVVEMPDREAATVIADASLAVVLDRVSAGGGPPRARSRRRSAAALSLFLCICTGRQDDRLGAFHSPHGESFSRLGRRHQHQRPHERNVRQRPGQHRQLRRHVGRCEAWRRRLLHGGSARPRRVVGIPGPLAQPPLGSQVQAPPRLVGLPQEQAHDARLAEQRRRHGAR